MALERVPADRSWRELLGRGVLAVVGAVALNWIVLTLVLVADAVAAYEHLEYGPVTTLTVLGSVGAVVAYAVVDRLSRRPDRTFLGLAVVVLLLSFVPDIGLLLTDDAATVGAVAVLMVMHVTTAAVCVAVLTDLGR